MFSIEYVFCSLTWAQGDARLENIFYTERLEIALERIT